MDERSRPQTLGAYRLTGGKLNWLARQLNCEGIPAAGIQKASDWLERAREVYRRPRVSVI